MSNDPKRLQELFLRLLEVPSEDRSDALERECGSDAELRQQVEALLKAHEEPDSYLDQPGDEVAATMVPPAEEPDAETSSGESGRRQNWDLPPTQEYESSPESELGEFIAGRYTLKEKIGEGGMGEVWVAKQSEPLKRKVALKLIKTGMDSKAVLARFEQERQALAMMDHPNIARVLDGGITGTGHPFFVMELVNGLPLIQFCDEATLSVNERLDLFVLICQAVQHAHQKGIVHRDLKPANILVTIIDGRPVPKVIDFGVAKATSGKLTDESLSTQFGAIVGTLEYMSPEQAGYTGDDVDTRADIYSLGVILYELLTGLRPIDAARLKQAAFTEMIRIIREVEPSKPSTRLSTEKSLPSLAALRKIDPRKLTTLLSGELDWIVMKCLEKQRDRRYETANGLLRDIQRYLADEPVEARPPSPAYRMRKFVSRNKGPVITASLVLLTLLGGIIGTSLGWIEAKRQEGFALDRAEGQRLARNQAEKQQLIAENALQAEQIAKRNAFNAVRAAEAQAKALMLEKELAKRDKQIGQAVKDFLLNKLLRKADAPLNDGIEEVSNEKQNLTIGELLDQAATVFDEKRIQKEYPGQPYVQAEILNLIGIAYARIGKHDRSIEFLNWALESFERGPDNTDTLAKILDCANDLVESCTEAGQTDAVLPRLEETLKLVKNKHSFRYLDAEKRDLAQRLLKTTSKLSGQIRGPNHPNTLNNMSDLAETYRMAGRLDLALPLEDALLSADPQLYKEELHWLDGLLVDAIPWHRLDPDKVSATEGGAILKEQKDFSVLASGPHIAGDIYTIEGTPSLTEIRAIRLEVLPHSSLPKSGPGRNRAGNFLLAKFRVFTESEIGQIIELPIANAWASYTYNQHGGGSVLGTIDDKDQRFWHIFSKPGERHFAVFVLRNVLRLSPGQRLIVKCEHKRESCLGRFRLSITDEPDAIEQIKRDMIRARKLAVVVLKVWLNQEKADTTIVQQGLNVAKATENLFLQEWAVRACCLKPIEGKRQLAAVLELARSVASRAKKNGEYDSGFQLGLGMAEYRNHAYAAAENALLTAEKFPEEENPHLVLTSRFYRAMSLYRQGKLKNARELFQSTAKQMKPLPEKPRNPSANQANINDVVVWLAYKEAKALIQFSKPEKPAIAQKSRTD